MAIDPNEVAAWVNSITNKSYLLQLRKVIDERLVMLGFPRGMLAGATEEQLALAQNIRPVPVAERLIKKTPAPAPRTPAIKMPKAQEGLQETRQGTRNALDESGAVLGADCLTESEIEALGGIPD